ncbi:hypothetical protein CC86DRAFT_415193 [Ophiobolus disseminans]|uniref:BTB domain-containing protein n=1 Tax=Ophiobolus disseminans TaxID=1469910 RepID=A0A6A7AKD9_9PLEO|nr:hypothetical protein CC86DRAFT_415193 [Ophiobolus disseminans]
MADKVYKIAPNPDAIIVLKNPLLEFAVWEKPAVDTAAAPQTSDDDNAAQSLDVAQPTKPTAVENPAARSLFGAGTSADNTTDSSQLPTNVTATNCHVNDTEDTADAVLVGGIHYHCSAAHLKLASKTFEKALSGEWAESVRKDNGRHYIIVEDWDEAALCILLNIIHLRNDQVPSEIDLEMLAKIATLIDYYQSRKATIMWTDK